MKSLTELLFSGSTPFDNKPLPATVLLVIIGLFAAWTYGPALFSKPPKRSDLPAVAVVRLV